MGENSKTVANLKGQLSKFSGIISKSFKKPTQKPIKEMLYRDTGSKRCEVKQYSTNPERGTSTDKD